MLRISLYISIEQYYFFVVVVVVIYLVNSCSIDKPSILKGTILIFLEIWQYLRALSLSTGIRSNVERKREKFTRKDLPYLAENISNFFFHLQ